MVHSSLSKIGMVEGGVETVVSALKQVVGEEGLLVMPSFPAPGRTFEYIKKNRVFSACDTHSSMGIITEIFRNSEGVYRSLHPTHPLIAWGNDSKIFVQGHLRAGGPFSAGTPFEKIKSDNFKVLMIGVDFENMTVCRIIEDLNPELYPDPYLSELFSIRVIDVDGREYSTKIRVHNPEVSKKRRNMILYPFMKERGTVKEFYLGKAKCCWVYAADVYETQVCLAKRGIYTYIM
jgi:aminoglycoside 3-N-acetyltransferase